jgi:VanZ family protein
MLPHRLPRPIRIAAYAAATAVLLYLCLAPSQSLPRSGLDDNWEHAAGWFLLAGLGLALSPRRPRAIAAFSLGVAVLVEALQAAMRLGRHGDWRDLAMDALGVALAFAVYWALRARLREAPANG